jgi:hypothetical protein
VIYVISGAGGKLVDDKHAPTAVDWTRKQEYKVCSLTVLDISADRVTLKQVSDTGKELDRFSVTKPKALSANTQLSQRQEVQKSA